jgi:glutamate synthase domain-containing protein 1
MHLRSKPTGPVGLYDPSYEHDACGVAMVARLNGVPTHETVQRAVVALANLEHRGAAGADPNTGDGAGILMQIRTSSFVKSSRKTCRLRVPTAWGCASCRRTRPSASSSSAC